MATEYVQLLKRRGALAAAVLVTYRCRHRCVLARIIGTKVGPVVHCPRYKLSPALNAASSSPSGRGANTEDGDRRWRERTFLLADALNIPINCDHVRDVLDVVEVLRDLAERHAEILLPEG
jgi:hypothetical protein